MFLLILCLLWVAMAAFDAGHTIYMLTRHGIAIEMNGLIRKLCGWWGISKGVIAGIFIPTCAIAGLCWLFQVEILMQVLVALRITLFIFQLKYHFSNVKPA